MQLTQSTSFRQEMRQLLTPRMIQSMEILQLPQMALEERIEQELGANPVLEQEEGDLDSPTPPQETMEADERDERQSLVVKDNDNQAEDFNRLEKISEYLENEEYIPPSGNNRASGMDGERDKKMDAMANTAAKGISLTEYLLGQWTLVECSPGVRAAGEAIINYIDQEGYLRTDLETIARESKKPLDLKDLNKALSLVQTMDPPGVGARNLPECLMLQLDDLEQDEELSEGHDLDLERRLLSHHLRDLEMNRYPQISKKLGRGIGDIKAAVKRLSHLHPHPGKQIGQVDAPPVIPDAIIYLDPESGQYEIKMAHDPASNLSISAMYQKMMKNRQVDKKTREFLVNNVRNARWLMDAIEQRRGTIRRVIRVVVDAQREFFEQGPEHLKPLPMILVADQLGIHVATVSRAVSEKWIQTPRGVLPLRKFFSGGTTNAEGEDMSWDAVKEKLRIIIDNEDKTNPLNDEEIGKKINDQGIPLARRTVAKYRKILNIPTARQRREF